MTTKVKDWIAKFYKNHSAPIRQIFSGIVCDICEKSLDNVEEVYNGSDIGMPHYNICSPCKLNQNDLPIRNKQCEYKSKSEKCISFDLGQGWHYDDNRQSNICMRHCTSLNNTKYRYINKNNLIKINTSKTSTVYHDPEGKGAGFSCNMVPLTLPKCITDARYIQVAEKWFGIKEHNGTIANCPWTDLVQLNGMRLNDLQDKFIVYNRQFTNICEWVPFDMIENGSYMAAYGAYVIVNCNPESDYYLKIATVIFDEHFRVGVDFVNMTIQNYLILRDEYNKNALTAEPVHTDIICDGCNMTPIIGTRWVCQECSEYDLCDECHGEKCHMRKGKIHLMEIEKAPEILFIEHLRIELKHGFYFA
jgi:hypothetical protein